MNWRAQLNGWSAENQQFWRECLVAVRADHPTWSSDYCEFYAFRQIRDILLAEGALMLEDIPGWNATGRARTYAEIQALPKDDSAERLAEARRDAVRREAEARADNEPDEPRRQFVGARR